MSDVRKEDVGLSDIFRAGTEQLSRTAQEAGENVKGFVGDVGRNVSDFVRPGLEAADKGLGQAAIGGAEKVNELSSMSLPEHAEALGTNVNAASAAVTDTARSAGEGVANFAGKGAHEVGNFFSDVGRNLENARANVLGGVGDFFQGQAEGAQGRAQELDSNRGEYQPFSFEDGAAKAGALGASQADSAGRGSIEEMHRQDTADISKRIGKEVDGPEVG